MPVISVRRSRRSKIPFVQLDPDTLQAGPHPDDADDENYAPGGAHLGSYDDAVPAHPVAFCSHIRERATRSRVQQLAAHVRTGWR